MGYLCATRPGLFVWDNDDYRRPNINILQMKMMNVCVKLNKNKHIEICLLKKKKEKKSENGDVLWIFN
jgi:hypothetical protein